MSRVEHAPDQVYRRQATVMAPYRDPELAIARVGVVIDLATNGSEAVH